MAHLSKQLPLALLAIVGLLALVVTVIDFVNPANGIHGTEGVVLVMISSALLLLAALLLWFGVLRGWVAGLFEVLIFLDFLGSGAAGYLLEDWLLVALMAVGFVLWLAHILPSRRTPSPIAG